MPYVVTEPCHMCRFTDCVTVCPVDAFHGDDERVYIDPDACIDCGACEPQCPVKAIVEDRDAEKDPALAQWVKINDERARELPITTQRCAATSEVMLAKREETLVRVTGKTAAQRAAQRVEEERLLVEKQRRQEEEYARKGELRAKSLQIEREARARDFASWLPVVCKQIEVAMSEIEGATAIPARQRESLLVVLLKELLPVLKRLEDETGGDEDFDEDEDESAVDDPAVDAYEKAHFVVRRALAELKKLGAELELEESTECLGMEGYCVEGSTKRRLLVGKNTLASWEQGIYGESQQFGTGLWVTKGKTCADRGSFVPAASFLERNGLELSHPGFPTDHWEALEWAGVGDEDEDYDEDDQP